MKVSNRQLLLTVLVVCGTAGLIWLSLFRTQQNPANAPAQSLGAISIVAIERSDYQKPNPTMDIITLSDGTKFGDLGWSVTHVATLFPKPNLPVFLLRKGSCPTCEAQWELILATRDQSHLLALPFAESHTLVDSENNQEVVDLERRIAFGHCVRQTPSLLVIEKSRQVDSDGDQLRIPDEWEFKVTTIEFESNGLPILASETGSSFERIETALSESCVEITPEETHEVL